MSFIKKFQYLSLSLLLAAALFLVSCRPAAVLPGTKPSASGKQGSENSQAAPASERSEGETAVRQAPSDEAAVPGISGEGAQDQKLSGRPALQWLSGRPDFSAFQNQEGDDALLASFAQNVEALAAQMHGSLEEGGILSPLSLYLALIPLREGLSPSAQAEFDAKINPAALNRDDFARLAQLLHQRSLIYGENGKEPAWESRSFVVASDRLSLHPDYQAALEQLKVGALSADLKNRASFAELNQLIADASHGIISPFYSEEEIQKYTEEHELLGLMLHTLYYRNFWDQPFDPDLSKEEPFYGSKGESTVSMMHSQIPEVMEYLETDAYIAVRKPYLIQGTMLILMPKQSVSREQYWAYLNEAKASQDWMWAEVTLALPRWSQSSELNLMGVLKSMDLENILIRDSEAHFFSSDEPLFLSTAKQRVDLRVNEKGTEAAAATALGLEGLSLAEAKPSRKLTLDHPFVYSLEDQGLPLLQGIVSDLPQL